MRISGEQRSRQGGLSGPQSTSQHRRRCKNPVEFNLDEKTKDRTVIWVFPGHTELPCCTHSQHPYLQSFTANNAQWGTGVFLICTRYHKTVTFKIFSSSGFFTKDCKKTSRGRIIDFHSVMKLHMHFYRSSRLSVFPFSLHHRGKLSYFTGAYCKSDKFSQSGWRLEVEKPSGKYRKCN